MMLMSGFRPFAATEMPEIIPQPLTGTISTSRSGTCNLQSFHFLNRHTHVAQSFPGIASNPVQSFGPVMHSDV